jgi:superoxide dismutase, Fe-Mn family
MATEKPNMQPASQPAMEPAMQPAMELALAANFGSYQRWCQEFAACANTLVDRAGCARLRFVPGQVALVHEWTANAQCSEGDDTPLLVLAASELADYQAQGLAANAAVQACIQHIDWAAVYERYQHAVHAASEGHGAQLDEAAAARLVAGAAQAAAAPNAPLVIDVRRAGVYEKASTTLPGAGWKDPALVGTWAAHLPPGREVLVYCVYGHEVGRATALRLRAAGVKARYLEGGIDAWQSAGRPLHAKPAATAPAP